MMRDEAIDVEEPSRLRDSLAIAVAFVASWAIVRLTHGRALDAERLAVTRDRLLTRYSDGKRRATAAVLDGAASLLLQLADVVDVAGDEDAGPN